MLQSLAFGFIRGHYEKAWCEGESAPGFFYIRWNTHYLSAGNYGLAPAKRAWLTIVRTSRETVGM